MCGHAPSVSTHSHAVRSLKSDPLERGLQVPTSPRGYRSIEDVVSKAGSGNSLIRNRCFLIIRSENFSDGNVIGGLDIKGKKETRFMKSGVGNKKKEKDIAMKSVSRWRRPRIEHRIPGFGRRLRFLKVTIGGAFKELCACTALSRLSHPCPADDSSKGLNLLCQTTGIVVWYPKRSRDWMNSGRESNLGSMVVAVGKPFSPSPVFERFWYLM